MTTSVLITTWKRPTDLRRCLEALGAQTRPPDEVVVVAREDDRETWDVLGEPHTGSFALRGVEVTKPGVVPAVNRGLAAGTGDLVCFTDDDACPRPDWLASVEAHFRADPRLGALGGRDWVHHGPRLETGTHRVVGKVHWYGRLRGNHHLGAGPARDVDVLKGVNMSFRRAALDQIELGERFLGSGIQLHFEVALSLAVKRNGWRVAYDPEVAVDHYPAQRFDEDQRGRQSLEALYNSVHNETYALLSWLPWGRKLPALAYGLLVGTRQAPGLVTFGERMLRDGDRPAVRDRFSSAQRGRIAGLRSSLPRVRRLLRPLGGFTSEIRRARPRMADRRSLLRYAADLILFRGLYFIDLPGKDRERTIRLEGGVSLTYRLNRGDIQSIREVWLEECYRPPAEVRPEVIVDLGANIALTSLWYAKQYGVESLVCVEPDPNNARLARKNLESNGVRADVVEAAVGPSDGTVIFADSGEANLGRVSSSGREVAMVSMATLLARVANGGEVDLVKMDIEGSEQELLRADLDWLSRVRSLIVEFHPERVNQEELVRAVERQGFRYVPAGSVRWNSMDFFTR